MRLYELGNIYLPKQTPVTELPEERMQFTLGMYGEGDFYTMKGVVEELFDKLGMHEKAEYDPSDKKSFRPGSILSCIRAVRQISYITEMSLDI